MSDSYHSWVCNVRLWSFGSHEFTEFAHPPEPMISKGLLVNITANLTMRVLKHQKMLGVLSISQGANEQFLQFKYSSFLEFWEQTPAFTFSEMTVLLCSFFKSVSVRYSRWINSGLAVNHSFRWKWCFRKKGQVSWLMQMFPLCISRALCKLSMCWRKTMYSEMPRH